MPPKTWKAYELKIARKFGTEREKGRAMDFGQSDIDFKTSIFAGQCKFNRKLPHWAEKDIKKALMKYPDKIPIIVFTAKNSRVDWAIVNLDSFLKLIK